MKQIILFWCFFNACIFYRARVEGKRLSELPDCSGSSVTDILESSILVSTLDGRITALNGENGGAVKWSLNTGPASLLSSSIHKLELTNHGQWVRMIPSLSGRLYRFNGVNIEIMPVRADHLLHSSSYLLSDGLVISGGRETRIYVVAVDTGQVLFECNMRGCDNSNNLSTNTIVIQRYTQTVRAIDVHSGNERWNFSVGHHDVKISQSVDCETNSSPSDLDIKTIIPEGLVFGVQKTQPQNILWKRKLPSPIVAVWKLEHGKLNNVDLFSGNAWSEFTDFNGNRPVMAPTIYLGMHQKQLYIQESSSLLNDLRITYDFSENELMRTIHLPWEPVTVKSTSSEISTKLNPGTNNEDSLSTTAMSVLYASEFVNGNGFFLFNKQTGLVDSEQMCSRNEDSTSNNTANDTNTETPIQIIVSLWYWWKEVLVISLLTAVLVNLIVTQRVLRLVRRPGEEESVKQLDFSDAKKPLEKQPSRSSEDDTSNYSSRYLLDFEPIQCLGQGGFGVVFEARNKIDDCNYAIKRIALPNSLESRDKVLREVKALAKLDHQNIVRYFNAWMECPPLGWQEQQDSVTIDINRSHSGFTDPDSTSGVSTKIDGLPSSNKWTQFSTNRRNINACYKTSNDASDNSSFIVFEPSQPCNANEKLDYVSLNTEDASTSAELVSTDVVKTKNHSSDKELEQQNSQSSLDVQFSSAPTRMYLYIQMQLCLKESLKEWLSKNIARRDKRKMLQIFEQIVHAVEYIHLEGLIHRDLKPSNIFFSVNGQIKVGDFGLVTTMTNNSADGLCQIKSYDSEGKHTAQVGTQLYMSPEQVNGLPYDYKVDIYSLGVILFELLYPFNTQMERSHVLLTLRRNIFPEYFKEEFTEEHTLLCLMLAQNPEKRPTTFGIRARPPLANAFGSNKEQYLMPEWHFSLPTDFKLKSNSYFL